MNIVCKTIHLNKYINIYPQFLDLYTALLWRWLITSLVRIRRWYPEWNLFSSWLCAASSSSFVLLIRILNWATSRESLLFNKQYTNCSEFSSSPSGKNPSSFLKYCIKLNAFIAQPCPKIVRGHISTTPASTGRSFHGEGDLVCSQLLCFQSAA